MCLFWYLLLLSIIFACANSTGRRRHGLRSQSIPHLNLRTIDRHDHYQRTIFQSIKSEHYLYQFVSEVNNVAQQLLSENECNFYPYTITSADAKMSLLTITEEHVKNPFKIAEEVIHIMHQWYHLQYKKTKQEHFFLKFASLSALSSLLKLIERHPTEERFSTLYQLLLDVYPTEAQVDYTRQNYVLFYRFVYYERWLKYISNSKLEIMSVLGENKYNILFKVKVNEQILQLKVYKEASSVERCSNEWKIMKKISVFNDKNQVDYEIPVPRVITSIAGISLELHHKNLILMEFIPSTNANPFSQPFSPPEAIAIYEKLSPAIIYLGKLGISYDIKKHQIVTDEDGKWWLSNFEFVYDLSDYVDLQTNKQYAEMQFMFAPWLYFSPQFYQFNDQYVFDSADIGETVDTDRMKTLIINGNLYTFQATILHYLMEKDNDEIMKRKKHELIDISLQINRMLHIKEKVDLGMIQTDPYKNMFKKMWGIRSDLAIHYIRKYPSLQQILELLVAPQSLIAASEIIKNSNAQDNTKFPLDEFIEEKNDALCGCCVVC